MSAALQSVLTPLAESKASIEGAFLRVGEGLGRGLEIFGELNAGLAALSGELDGGGIASATASLDALSRELIGISAGLPQDSATLRELVDTNAGVSVRLVRLIDNMRMMAILARSARIEAVVFDSQGAEYIDFTQEITTLTRRVQGEIETCAREHGKLSAALCGAAKAQHSLERDYRDRLVALARELAEAFATIQGRRERGATLMQDVTARAAGIAGAAGAAIMSLQAGDSTRQRLEHVHDAMERVSAFASQDDETATALAMCRLQDAQLRDTAACFDADLGSIDGALDLLARETGDLVALGQSVFGDAGHGSESFLTSFRERLSDAARVIETCEAARGSIERVVADLRRMLDGLTEAITGLNEVILDIVLIGVNAGLKAGRLGSQGRSLVVIAQELKEIAAAIAADAQELLPVFDTLQDISRRLERAPADDAPPALGIHAAMTALVSGLDGGGQRLGACLKALEAGGRSFEAELDHARHEFTQMAAMTDLLREAAEQMREFEQTASPADRDSEAAWRAVDGLMAARYTMAREREIHASIVGEHALEEDAAQPDVDEDALAGMLF